jgi:hypothetical protein
MANNLHISYDLHDPGRNYHTVIAAIQGLGAWAKIHYSFWYVRTDRTAEQARDILARAIDANDSIYVVDSTNNVAAWKNISSSSSQFIRSRWYSLAAA